MWVEWSPPGSSVTGRYESPEFEDGRRLPQAVEARCEACGEQWRGTCESGRVREKIARFATLHRHGT
jgi:hypothetical protein